MILIAEIGTFISLAFPLVLSIYKETRFVPEKNLLINGIALIVFSLSYTSYAKDIPPEYSYLSIVQWLFFILGIIMICLYSKIIRNPITMGKQWGSLVYSWKNFGAFEIAFMIPVYFKVVPQAFFNPTPFQIINLGINILLLFWLLTAGVFVYRNWIREKD